MTEHQIVLLVISLAAVFVVGYVVRSLLLLLVFYATRRVLKGVALALAVKMLLHFRKWPWL